MEESVIESEESLSILNDDVKKAAKRVSEAQEELKSYVKELERELKEKVQQKEASIKEAETDYQAARANVEAAEVAKMACEHFGSLLTNTDICLGEMKDAFPELQRLYERPNEAVVQQRKTLSELMAKVKERKRGDSMSAAGTPAQGTPGEKKEEKKPVAKKMPEDIKKKQQMMKDYEEKQELLKKKLEEAKASAESIGRQRPSEPEGEKVKNTLRAVQGLVLVAHVCKVRASAPDDVNIVLAQEPASRFSQEVSTGERKLSEGKMLNAVELASGVEIFLLVCGLVYVFQQIMKAIRVSLKGCKRRQVEIDMVYAHRGRKVFHLKSCMWCCPPPKTMEMTKEEAWNQGFRSCWKCHPEDRPQKKPQEAVGSNTQGRGGICGQRCT